MGAAATQIVYTINFAPCEIVFDNNIDEVYNNQRLFLKEDGSPFFIDELNAELTMINLIRQYPSNRYWITNILVKTLSHV